MQHLKSLAKVRFRRNVKLNYMLQRKYKLPPIFLNFSLATILFRWNFLLKLVTTEIETKFIVDCMDYRGN